MSLSAFVSGASGFVGSNLVHELHQQGWDVHVLARASSSMDDLEGIPFALHIGDVTDRESIRGAIPNRADCVFHVAASTNLWSKNNEEQTRINVDGTRNMIEAAIEAKAGRFVHTSSFVTWGFRDREINENSHRTNAFDWINYVHTKHVSETLVLKACESGHLDAVVTNPANVLGPGDRHNWSRIFRMIWHQNLPGVGPAGGNFCDVREVAKAHVQAYHRGRAGEKYLLGGEFAEFTELVGLAGEMLGKPVPGKPTPAWLLKTSARLLTGLAWFTGKEPDITPEVAEMISHDISCDSSKAEKELGFRSVPLRDMVRDTIDWMFEKGLMDSPP